MIMEIAHRAKIVLQEVIEYVIKTVIKEGVVNAQNSN
jgi:predicted transcriptional regulator